MFKKIAQAKKRYLGDHGTGTYVGFCILQGQHLHLLLSTGIKTKRVPVVQPNKFYALLDIPRACMYASLCACVRVCVRESELVSGVC